MNKIPNEAASDVTQADRDAAAEIYRRFEYGNERLQRNVKSGQMDDEPVVQAFARHRIAATRKHDPSALEALGKALFVLSARMKTSGFLDDDQNHAAYEQMVAAWEASQ